MKGPALLALVLLCTGCANLRHQSRDPAALATLPADPDQAKVPQWVLVSPPYPLTLSKKVEIDLNSIHKTGDGGITVWSRDTYIDEQVVSPTETYRIGEARYWFDCARKLFNIDYVHTRKGNGALVRSRLIEIATRQTDNPIPPRSLISAEADLACSYAEKR